AERRGIVDVRGGELVPMVIPKAATRFALRLLVAGMLSYGIATALGLGQVYWSVATAFLVIQASVRGTLQAAVDRFFGTVAGAVAGATAAWLEAPRSAPGGVMLVAALCPACLAAGLWPGFRVAPITAAIVRLTSHGGAGSVFDAAVERVIEI